MVPTEQEGERQMLRSWALEPSVTSYIVGLDLVNSLSEEANQYFFLLICYMLIYIHSKNSFLKSFEDLTWSKINLREGRLSVIIDLPFD